MAEAEVIDIEGVAVLPDGEVERLTPEQAAAVLEAAEAAEAERQAKLKALAGELLDKFDTVVKAKRQIEARWIDDLRQYEGNARLADTKGVKSDSATEGQAPRIHVTRARTDLWEARLADMLLPAQDSAWDMTPSEDAIPDGDEGEQARVAADAACEAMADTIRGQLDECHFERSARRCIRDACRIGTGLVMGPMNGTKVQRRFGTGPDGENVVEIIETSTPEIREADPWCFYPDLTPSAESAEFAFYVHLMSRREVIELAGFPGFDADAIRRLLKEGPELGELGTNIAKRNEGLDAVEPTSGRYAVLRYTGVLEPEDLRTLGLCGCDGGEADPLDQQMVDLWMCQTHILMASISRIEHDYRIPYYVFSPFPADDTMFGYGLPYLCRDSARVADASYRIALHNLSVSSGPLVIMRKGAVTPADGNYTIRGPKTFYANDSNGADRQLSDLLAATIIPNVAEQAFEALDKALQIVDMELNAEGWASQEPGGEAQTASGLAMVMNAKSIIQRRAAACADDELFRPVIERMYWWNMRYNPNPAIRGEYDVTTCSQSVLLVKDVQVQHTLAFLQMAYSNPDFAPYINSYEALQSTARLFDMPNRARLLKSKEEADREAQAKGQDPQQAYLAARTTSEQAKAQALAIETRIKQAKAQREAAQAEADDTFRQADRQMDHEEELATLEARLFEAKVRAQVAVLHEETARVEAMRRMQIDEQQLQARLAAQQASDATKLRLKGVDAGMQAHEMAIKQRFGSGI